MTKRAYTFAYVEGPMVESETLVGSAGEEATFSTTYQTNSGTFQKVVAICKKLQTKGGL